MKKILTVVLTLLLVGCASVSPAENVSYPVQTEENVQNNVQNSEPEQNSTESGTDLPDTQDSAENDDLGEPNQDSRERTETDENETVDAPNVEESARSSENRWLQKCREFGYRSSNEWAEAYLEIISDICETKVVNEDVAHIIYAPSVDPEHASTKKYVETILFSQTFWAKYMSNPDKPYWVIATPADKDWWAGEYSKYVTEGSSFTCPYFTETYFCSYKYYPPEGKTVVDSEVHLFVLDQTKELSADAYVDPAHNAVHWYQDASDYTHWHEFLIEGHATLYEIAFHILENSNQSLRQAERQRESFAWLSHSLDKIKFTATTAQGVLDHWDACYGRGYDCNHYYYGGGAMFHERLILDFGYNKYLSWHEKLDAIASNSEYFSLFESYWGISLSDFDETRFAPYVAESFNYYYSIW